MFLNLFERYKKRAQLHIDKGECNEAYTILLLRKDTVKPKMTLIIS